ncbi:MAG: rubrerythrin family protein [Tissierellia bacterium]|nr:rubrerythrin family protein [Tissierellia bacterium]
MNAMTAENLRSAFGGESQAHMRYRIWGSKAGNEGFPTVERLFMATSDAEEVHATLHFNALKDQAGDFSVTSMAGFGLGSTSENLQGAIDGEMFEVEQMYPAYIAVAEMQGEKAAISAMRFAIEAEKVHAELFTKAKEAVDKGEDLKADTVLLCPVCGFITLTGVEANCPICNAKKELFVEY